MTTLDLLDRLIAFPTVSRDTNLPLIDFVRDRLAARGVASEIIPSADGLKANLFATIGPRDVPGILLSGHTDVVPVDGQDWSRDPFRMAVADGRAYGRGTADMKGFVACALALVERIDASALDQPIHLALSHDEEIGCVGVRSLIAALRDRAPKPRLAIVGEPTLLRVATGHKGKIAARATCIGVEGHSALAPNALNAVHLACDLVRAIRQHQEAIVAKGARDAGYAVPYTTLHVGRIAGGTALNIVPNLCTVDFEIRNVAADDAGAILDAIAGAAALLTAEARRAFPQAGIRIEALNAYPGLATPDDADAVGFVAGLVGGGTTFKVAFGTEAGLFTDGLGVPAIVCGPGSMEQGHRPDEFIALDQLAACDRMLDRLAATLAR